MASSLLLTLLLTSTIVLPSTAAMFYEEKTTCLELYNHIIYGGPNANIKDVLLPLNNISLFGEMIVFNSELRSGPEATSELIGRAEGFSMGSSMQESSLITIENLVFFAGKYSGSTMTAVGRLVVGDPTSVRSIVGGTGAFSMAKGYAVFKAVTTPLPVGTVKLPNMGKLINSINVVVVHN